MRIHFGICIKYFFKLFKVFLKPESESETCYWNYKNVILILLWFFISLPWRSRCLFSNNFLYFCSVIDFFQFSFFENKNLPCFKYETLKVLFKIIKAFTLYSFDLQRLDQTRKAIYLLVEKRVHSASPSSSQREHKKEISRANIKVVEAFFIWIYSSLSL